MTSSPLPGPSDISQPADSALAPGLDVAPGFARSVAAGALALEPYATVFLASGVTLILEIVAARILAPHIGVSVYTWTSIIGVILAGISLGNWLGGVFADRWGGRAMLGVVLLLGVATTAIIPVMAGWAPGWVGGLPILLRIVLLTLILFIAPSLVLAMVSPVVIKLTLKDLGKTGSVAGRIYAVSTAGAILGTFLTGFVLIQAFGSQQTVYGLAAVLTVLAVVSGRLWRTRKVAVAGMALLAGAGAVPAINGPLSTPCLEESNYFCIRVAESERDGHQVKELILDQLVHSYIRTDDPTHLEYPYQKLFAELVAAYPSDRPDFRALFIGGGGYEMPRYVEETYSQSVIEVIEIDPRVTQTAFDHLGLRPDSRVTSINRDARMTVPDLPRAAYDIVVGDAFNDMSVPWHLTTLEFNGQVKELLRPGGIYAVNIIDAPSSGRFLRAVVHTLRQTWPHVYIVNATGQAGVEERSTTVVAASDRELDENFIRLRFVQATGQVPALRIVRGDLVDEWLNARDLVLLTDDYAPVDNYVAPIYLGSR